MNLIYKHGEPQHFKITTYPDGQQTIQLDMDYFKSVKEPINIICSIRNFKELEVFLCLVSALRKNDFHIDYVFFHYLMGMRSDRAFKAGEPNYFRDVIAPILNGLNVEFKVLYPHSRSSIMAIDNAYIGINRWEHENECYIIGADDSSLWQEFAKPDAPRFYKKRTDNGLLVNLNTRIHCEINALPEHMPILVKDDLCDGGATFIAIAEYLESYFPDRKRYLFVIHGLFTKGVEHVTKHYDKVITTNSYQEFDNIPKLEVLDIWKP